MIGTNLGRYRILTSLGEGGMGRVYVGEDPSLGRRVAIKVLPPGLAGDVAFRARLLLEARAASALNHPNIVTVYDLGEDDERLFVAMELVDGVTLRTWAGQKRRPPAEVLALARQATGALAVAHAQGLVHRDFKPDNVMVRRDGLLKILDFGLARSVAPAHGDTIAHTLPGTVVGTVPYMSPEQVLGRPAGPASDVFAVGTVLHELLTGRHPFAAASAIDTMHRILHESPDPPSSLVPGLPPSVDFVLAKALARDPARRYATAADLDVDLEACLAALAARDAAPVASAPAPSPAGASARSGPRAIAVLPFKHIGGGEDLDWLGIGLADALITRLSTSPDLVVRSTSAIARYEKTPVDPRHVAQELEVDAVLDASFQRAASLFRARARLIEEPGGRALWAGTIDLDVDDLFTVQDEVAAAIANAMSARLRGPDAVYAPSPEAFEFLLRAREPDRTGTREGLLRKIGFAERAVGCDPGYADAWAYLAKLRQSMADAGFDPDEKWLRLADEACAQALEIAPTHSYARYVLGSLQLVRGRKREAYAAFAARHREHPNDYQPLHYLAYVFRLSNLLDRALAAEDLAMARDPASLWSYWSVVRMLAESRRDAEAAEIIEKLERREPGQRLLRSLPLLLLRNRGAFAEIVERVEGFDRPLEDSRVTFEWGYALARLGRTGDARRLVEPLERFALFDMDFAAYHAALLAWLGETDRAFFFLARATELGNDCVYLYEREDLFGPLHGDPRWSSFLAGAKARAAADREVLLWPVEGAGAGR